MLKGLIFLFLLGFVSPLWAQSGASVQYLYDALGRLTTVVDPSGNVATYNYDAVGNLLSITRTTTFPSALAIFGFSPAQGGVGQTVVIQGQNFSATPSANVVQFNGTTATVTAATANSLTVTVPTAATTGLINVTVGTATANSSSNFTVLAVPVITSVSPTQVLNTPTVSFQVNGSNLTGSTFSFVPAFTPAAISLSNVNINGNGTSATMTLTLASNAAGSLTVVATNGTGSTSSVPSLSNTLTVVSADPFADSDGDGLSNIYEAAIGTNYAAASTTGDGLPDGWALFYTSTPPLSAALAGQTAPNGLTYLQSFQRGLNPLLNTVAPSVSTVYPANNATNYPTNGVIVVRFTEPLLAGVSLTAAQNAINAALPTGSNFSSANASAAAGILHDEATVAQKFQVHAKEKGQPLS
jgi:YD repeat-containing protein